MRAVNRLIASSLAAATLMAAPAAHAVRFEFGEFSGTLNTVMTMGVGVRTEDRSINNLGKANINPGVCGGLAQSCQGVFRDQNHPAMTLFNSPGQAYLNADDGDWNYNKGDLTQAPVKITQDVNVTFGDYGLFAKWLYFYDFVNENFTEFHPNMITKANAASVGCTSTTYPAPAGQCFNTTNFPIAYGPGAPTFVKRTDGETLRQIGTDLQMFDYYIFGSTPVPFTEDHKFTWKLGSQTVNWGESTALVINSVNQVNPLNVNNLYRVGFDLSELFTPTRMAFASTELIKGASVEGYYGLQWKPVEIPAPGSFFSFADLGSYNALKQASISFGGPGEDNDVCGTATNPNSGCGTPTNNPLSGLTNTALTIRRQADHNASNTGQYGIALKYFADWLNNGTQLSFYFENYHSKLPYVSFISSDASCAKNATSGPTLLAACPDLPVAHPNGLNGGSSAATSNAVPIDTVKYFVEYPENIKLFGMSFNTTVGDISMQGEVSYRPNEPLQVDLQDLTFLALQPMLTRCGNPNLTTKCVGTNAGTSSVDGLTYGPSDFSAYPGTPFFGNEYKDTFDLGVGAADGSSRSFPSFIGAYRGIEAGEEAPNTYIRGWERFGVWQSDLGATYVEGATDNVIGADQVIWLFEAGAQYVPSLPAHDVLQIESPGTYYHASAGADGSMTGNYKQDCANTVDCNYGGIVNGQPVGTCSAAGIAQQEGLAVPGAAKGSGNASGCGDGLRFNPHQQPASDYATKFSSGFVIVNLTRYESVFPGISFAPITIFKRGLTGISTDVASQFQQGRTDATFIFETRYKESLSFSLGYIFIFGGHDKNEQSDRDEALAYVKYQF